MGFWAVRCASLLIPRGAESDVCVDFDFALLAGVHYYIQILDAERCTWTLITPAVWTTLCWQFRSSVWLEYGRGRSILLPGRRVKWTNAFSPCVI